MLNGSGVDADGVPYINLSPALPRGGLPSQSVSRFVEVQFEASPSVSFELKPEIRVGGANQAPVIDEVDAITMSPGQVEIIPIVATDADGDPVTLTLAGGQSLPSGTLTSSQRLELRPDQDDLGSYNITVIASDGVASTRQDIQVDVVDDQLSTTRVSGRILDVDGTPLASLPLELSGVTGMTDSSGRFTLDLGNTPLTSDVLRVRGDQFGNMATYPFVAERLSLLFKRDVILGVENMIDRPIYLPPLDEGTMIDPMVNTMVENPLLPGTEMMVEAGTLLTQQGTPFDGELSITEVPPAFTPISLPVGLAPDIVVTVQPGEMQFTQPTPLSLPNLSGWAPGTEMELWSIDPTTGEFDNVGTGTVSGDGTAVDTVEGGVSTSSWHFFAPVRPDPRGDIKGPESPQQSDPTCNANPTCGEATSSVDLFTGRPH